MSLFENYDEERDKLANIIEMLLSKNFKVITYDKKDPYPIDINPIPYFIQQLKFFKADEQIAKSRFESLLERLLNNMNNPIIKSEMKQKDLYRFDVKQFFICRFLGQDIQIFFACDREGKLALFV